MVVYLPGFILSTERRTVPLVKQSHDSAFRSRFPQQLRSIYALAADNHPFLLKSEPGRSYPLSVRTWQSAPNRSSSSPKRQPRRGTRNAGCLTLSLLKKVGRGDSREDGWAGLKAQPVIAGRTTFKGQSGEQRLVPLKAFLAGRSKHPIMFELMASPSAGRMRFGDKRGQQIGPIPI